jgi:DNA-binding transcriptional LysR family regulator
MDETRPLEDHRRLLPLVPQLAVLLSERNVSRAAARVGVTQPTMSRTLGAARQLVGDELIMRTASGPALTPRGQALLLYAQTTLRQLEEFWTPATFTPQAARGTIKLAATDYVSQTYLPAVVGVVRQDAPQLCLEVVPWSAEALARIERDEVQLGINPLGAAPRGFYRRRLAVDRYVVVTAARGGRRTARIDLDRFVQAPHVLTMTESGERGIVDRVLRAQGRRRTIVARVTEFQTAAALVGASDLVATLPERLAQSVRERFGLVLSPPPIKLPPITIDLIWHERRHRDALLSWMCGAFTRAAGGVSR